MYSVAMLVFLLPKESSVDVIKCIKMALIHDMAEALVGDITPKCGIRKSDKKRNELQAIK